MTSLISSIRIDFLVGFKEGRNITVGKTEKIQLIILKISTVNGPKMPSG